MYLPTVMGVGSERGGAGTHLTPHWCAMTGIWRGCGRGLVVLHGQVHRGDCGDGGDGWDGACFTSGELGQVVEHVHHLLLGLGERQRVVRGELVHKEDRE